MTEEGPVRRRSSVVADDEASDFLASMHNLGITDEGALEDDAYYDVLPFEEDDISSNASNLSYTYSHANLNQDVPSFHAHVSKPSMTNLILSPSKQPSREDSELKTTPDEREAAARAAEYKKHEEFEAELAEHASRLDPEKIYHPIKVYCGKCDGKGWHSHHPDCPNDVAARAIHLKKLQGEIELLDSDNRSSKPGSKSASVFSCCGGRTTDPRNNPTASSNACNVS